VRRQRRLKRDRRVPFHNNPDHFASRRRLVRHAPVCECASSARKQSPSRWAGGVSSLLVARSCDQFDGGLTRRNTAWRILTRSNSPPALSMPINLFKRFAGISFTAASLLTVGCVQPQPVPLPPLPALPQTCTFTSTPDVAVPASQGVRISVGRRATEPSLVSIATRVDDQLRQDGSMYVPGPDASFHPYHVNNPRYFARSKDSTETRHFTASMLWNPTGMYYDRPPGFSVLCLSINGAMIAFYTARTPEPSTIVKFDFYPPLSSPGKRSTPAVEPAVEQPAS